MIPEEKLAEIRERLPISELVSDYVQLKKTGKNSQGLCPFHQEKTPSFFVSPERDTFHCFGCGVGGNIFHFLMRIESLSFPEAVLQLADRTGVQVERGPQVSSETHRRRKRILEMNRQAAWYYHCLLKKLPKDHEIWNYLASRKVSDESIENFFLGYAPPKGSGLAQHLKQKGFSEKELDQSDLFKNRREFFRGRLIFPIFGKDSKVHGFGGRKINEKDFGPKYLNSSESEVFKKGELFYGIHLAKASIHKKGQVLLTEGYLDVITLHAQGFDEALAPLGTALTQFQAKSLGRMTQKVILLFDGDSAGEQASLRALEVLLGQDILPDRVPLESGEDPDSYLKRYGRLAFEKKLETRRNLLEELIDKASTSIPQGPSMLEEKGKQATRLLSHIQLIPNQITRNLYRRRMAESLEVPEDWLPDNKSSRAQTPPSAATRRKTPWLPEEEVVFECWLKFPQLHDFIKEKIIPEQFCTEKAVDLANIFWKTKTNENTSRYFDLAPPDLIGLLSELSIRMNGLEDQGTAKISLEQALYRLTEKRLQRDLQRLKGQVGPDQINLIQEKINALSHLFKEKKRIYGQE